MVSDFELRKQIRRVVGLDIYRATLGDASGRVDAPGLPGYVNIRYVQAGGAFSQPVTVRFRAVMKKTPGTAVIVSFDDDGELAVLRPDFVGETSVGTYPQGDNPADDNVSHFIQQQRLLTFACHPVSSAADSMLVTVQTGTVVDLSTDTFTLFFGSQEDLTSYIPGGAGEWCLACLFWKDDNTIEIFASTPKDNPDDLGFGDINECFAATTTGSLPIWAWRLYNGQTGIASGAPATGGDDFMDLRPLWFMLQAGGGSSLEVTDGTTTVDPTTTLDFDPAFFDVTAPGGGVAEVTFVGAVSPWITDTNVVNLVTDTDTVTIGSNTAGGKLFIDGDTDEIQLQIQGHSTQTNPLIVAENNAGTDQFSVSNTGDITLAGFIDLVENSAPSSPSSNHMRIYAEDEQDVTLIKMKAADGTVYTLGRQQFFIGRNSSGITLDIGKAVRYNSTSGATSSYPNITGSQNNLTTPHTAIGLAVDTMTTGARFGRVMTFGLLTMDTTAFASGDILYLKDGTTSGELIATAPVIPYVVQRVAICITGGSASGVVFVCPEPTYQTNDHAAVNVWNIGQGNGAGMALDWWTSPSVSGRLQWSPSANRTVVMPDVSGNVVIHDATQTLSNKTLTAPTVADFTNANHDHLDADDGGTLDAAAIASGTINEARLPHKFAVIEEQQATNTAGGGSTATTWTTRVLNTEVVDADGIVSISSNLFTPIAGTYRIFVNSPFLGNGSGVSNLRIRLRNNTAGSTELVSANHSLLPGQGVNATLSTEFTANGTDAYAIQYYITVARVTNGLGAVVNEASAVERYTQVFLEKIA